ncbi:MAG: thymidylate kinase [Planctomycetota bacterium]|jgi:dTMP kinase|nr:thymidylate kinase [Planctomycetota bacterium]
MGWTGTFLSLEGVDGAGKSLQLRLLAEFFQRNGRQTWTTHFPRTDVKPYGEMIAAYLRGEYGELDSVAPKLAALLYALDRREAAADLRSRLAAATTVIVDRYVHSNIAYQCARIPDAAARSSLARWIEELEYVHHALPRPDLSLFLDAPLAFSLRTVAGGRAGGDREYLRGGKDIHETREGYQEKARQAFLDFARERPTELAVIDCGDQRGGMAQPAVIHSRIVDALRYYGITSR